MSYVAWKDRVTRAFDAAAPTYDRAARAQKIFAAHLAQRIVDDGVPAGARVLELGCGTGFLTEALLPRIDAAHWRATDIAPAMVTAVQERVGLLDARVLDAEAVAPEDAGSGWDLICGSLVAQWFTDLPGTLERLYGALAPGGLMMLSLLGPDTFGEWRAACAAEGVTPGTPDYPDAETVYAMLSGDAWVMAEWKEVPHDSPQAFVRGLKAMGAHVPAGERMRAPQLRRVLRRLGDDGLTVTYHLLTARQRKPGA